AVPRGVSALAAGVGRRSGQVGNWPLAPAPGPWPLARGPYTDRPTASCLPPAASHTVFILAPGPRPLIPELWLPVFLDPRVQQLIDQPTVLEGALTQPAFQDEAVALQHARRRDVEVEDEGVNAREVKALERPRHEDPDRAGHQAAAPAPLAEPVPELGIDALDVRVQDDADAADRFPVDFDREIGDGYHPGAVADPGRGVLERVGVREAVAETRPDTAILGMPGERRGIVQAPVADDPAGERQP